MTITEAVSTLKETEASGIWRKSAKGVRLIKVVKRDSKGLLPVDEWVFVGTLFFTVEDMLSDLWEVLT